MACQPLGKWLLAILMGSLWMKRRYAIVLLDAGTIVVSAEPKALTHFHRPKR
jgi:hypothetical protein